MLGRDLPTTGLWYRVQSGTIQIVLLGAVSPSYTVPINCKTDCISYLCTYDLYSPVHNVLDACITAYPSGEQVGGHRADRRMPFGAHLGTSFGLPVVVAGQFFPNLSSNYDFTSKFDFLVLISVGPEVGYSPWARAINCLGRFTRLCIVDWRALSSGHDEKKSSECGMGGGGWGAQLPVFRPENDGGARVAKTLQYDQIIAHFLRY
jgi:hypothetical protein